MHDRRYLRLSIPLLPYSVITTIFLLRLRNLNNYLLEHFSDKSAIELLRYNRSQPLKFFVGAIVLTMIGGLLVYHFWKKTADERLEIEEVLVVFCSFFASLIFILLIISAITIPILMAILTVLFIGVIGCSVLLSGGTK